MKYEPFNLDEWKDERVINNILNENNGMQFRLALMEYFLEKHADPNMPITLYGNCTIRRKEEIKWFVAFYVGVFQRHGLLTK